MGHDSIRLFTVQGDSHDELVQRYQAAGRYVRRPDTSGHLHAKAMRLGPYNLDTSANGTTSTACNHERGSLCHITELGMQRALAMESRLAQRSQPLLELGSYNPSRPQVPAAALIYKQPAHRTT